MRRRFSMVMALVFVLVALIVLSSCALKGKAAASAGHPTTSTASPTPTPDEQKLAALVQTYARQVGELQGAPDTIMASSNPYDYAKYSPAVRHLIALGPKALPMIAHYILDHSDNGLNGYLLAIAGDSIWGSHGTPISAGAKSWETADQWARQYLAWAEEHPSGN